MINKNDPLHTLSQVITHAANQHPELMAHLATAYHGYLARLVVGSFNNTVAYGPFKGLKLSTDSHWSGADRASMVLGMYEQEILQDLGNLRGKYKTFIDLGAADGYYGIGVLVAGLFEKSYCFEISELGRAVIAQNAEINGFKEKVIVFGEADKKFYRQIDHHDLINAVLFVDIEGAEFDLFDADHFSFFSNTVIYIELHDWFFSDSQDKISKLRQDSERTHSWKEFHTGSRDPSAFSELGNLPDTARWLLCSEGRARLMTWVRLDPK